MNASPFHILAQDSLEKQQAFTQQLLNLLKQENQLLSNNHVDSLDDIVSDKQPLIIEIDALNQHWLALLAAESVESDPKRIAEFLKSCDQIHHTSLSEQWNELRDLAKDCQKTNAINGTIITLRYQSAQQTLAILRGQEPGDSVYDLQGNNAAGYTGGNALAKA